MTALAPQHGPVIAAPPSDLTAPFWEGCRQHRLTFQRCKECATPHFDPVHRCRGCMSGELMWEESAGRGVLRTWTVVWRPVVPHYAVPYAPAIVELDEGPHLVTCIVGCDDSALRAGLRVEVEFHADTDGVVLPYFTPSEAADSRFPR